MPDRHQVVLHDDVIRLFGHGWFEELQGAVVLFARRLELSSFAAKLAKLAEAFGDLDFGRDVDWRLREQLFVGLDCFSELAAS